jgi:2-dehydro-3-deoxyphosphooctonate aldolase (KDO 8-P synthase)
MTETNSEVAVGEGAGKVVFSNTGKLSLIAGPARWKAATTPS